MSERTMRCTPADRNDVGVGEALVHAVGDGAVVVQRREHFLHGAQHVSAPGCSGRFLLAGEGGASAGPRRWRRSAPRTASGLAASRTAS